MLLAGSGALLGGAFAFQFIGGYAPCEMCFWQRWPHVGVLVLGLIAWALRFERTVIVLAALVLFVGAGIGFFHAGVEYHWWRGPAGCTAPALAAGGDFVSSVLATPLIRCDAAAWTLFGISMAGYNALLSTLLGGIALWLGLKPSTK